MLSCGHKWIFTYMCAALTKCLETRESAIVHLLPLEKQSKQRRNRWFFKIPKFFEDKELCPVLALQTYFSKVRSANFELFIIHLCPCRCPVSTEKTYFSKVRSANFELFILLTYVVAGVHYPRRQHLLVRFLRETS